MPVELEAKMRVADLEAVRRKLRDVGAAPLGRVHEVNRFYDAADHRLRKHDQGLRLRTNRNTDSGDEEHVVTMKGPRQQGKFKTREELEFTTDNVETTATVFERLGYPLELLFEKRRESWKLDDCKVELDELPQIGTFVEIEGASEDVVQAVREKLGLGDEASITEGYAAMVSRKLMEIGTKELRFGQS